MCGSLPRWPASRTHRFPDRPPRGRNRRFCVLLAVCEKAGEDRVTVTSQLPELHPTRDFLAPAPAKTGLYWLIPVALGLLAGVGYAGWSAGDGGNRAPEPADPAAAIVLPVPAATEQTDDEDYQDLDSIEVIEATDEVEPAAAAPSGEAGENSLADAPPVDDGAKIDGFVVQVASYRSEPDAVQHAQALRGRDLDAKSVEDGRWFKVRLGPFESRADAEKQRFALTVSERREAYVLPRSNGKYHVQVGSFATAEEAEPIARKLEAKGHSTKISRIKMAGKRWYCVRIGPFDTHEEAEGYKALVDDAPGTKSRVIPFRPE